MKGCDTNKDGKISRKVKLLNFTTNLIFIKKIFHQSRKFLCWMIPISWYRYPLWALFSRIFKNLPFHFSPDWVLLPCGILNKVQINLQIKQIEIKDRSRYPQYKSSKLSSFIMENYFKICNFLGIDHDPDGAIWTGLRIIGLPTSSPNILLYSPNPSQHNSLQS